MPKTFNGEIQFPTNLDVQITRPLDDRLVVDSYDDLTNGSIEYPYQGMVVNIKGTSELWILKTQGRESARDINNWELVTGSGGGLSKYSIPVMTDGMVRGAKDDPDVEFDESEYTYIHIDEGDSDNEYIHIDDPFEITKTKEDVYLQMFHDMTGVIRNLQMEVSRLRNLFDYGIYSYNNGGTYKSIELNSMEGEPSEPLWAIDTCGLSLIEDSSVFNTLLDRNHTFTPLGGTEEEVIDVSVDGQLTFVNGGGRFYDGKKNQDGTYSDYTLSALTDSKLITYLVTDSPNIILHLQSLDNKNDFKDVNLSTLPLPGYVDLYGFCIVISRKVEVEETYKGFNYVYVSVIDFKDDSKVCEKFLNSNGIWTDTKSDVGSRYSIEYIDFNNLTLSRMKFYTKFEDFSEEVIPVAPDGPKNGIGVAHITIRSVDNTTILDQYASDFQENELIWNKKSGTLHIKSDGKIYLIGSNSPINPDDEHNNDDNMTDKEIVQALEKMGIIVNVEYNSEHEIVEGSLRNISLAPVSGITFINNETNKKFTFTVDTEGNLVGKSDVDDTIESFLNSLGEKTGDYDKTDYVAVRGFICDYLSRLNNETALIDGVNKQGDTANKSDRLRISSFYAPIMTDEIHGCTHSFVELENTSNKDIPLKGIYLHFFNPSENDYNGAVHHLALDGVIKAGSTYLIRGAKHAELDDESAFIKVKTFDKEWYENGEPVSFEQEAVKTADGVNMDSDSPVKKAYRFCLTYGLPNLEADTTLVRRNNASATKDDVSGEYLSWPAGNTTESKFYDAATYPTIILNPRFIDSCSYSTLASVANQTGNNNPWYANGDSKGLGITIKPNSMYRVMFALDPAKQAFNGFNTKDSSRVRYNKVTDIQVVDLSKEFIGYPYSNEIAKIDRYTPKASFENRNVMTDKSQLNREKPNMVTCSLGVDVYNTRCFNWISCGAFDEYIWLRKKDDTSWTRFESYKKVNRPDENPGEDTFTTATVSVPTRKEYSPLVNNAAYARIITRFPGNEVLFTAHKCVVILPEASTTPVEYEYVVGRSDKDGNPDLNHTNEIYTFKVYPRSYEGRLYQITDQQGFHWIEYQVWAAAAEKLNKKIDEEVTDWNSTHSRKVFPILFNTGDMTQSGARINEWLDYYNGGVNLFNHLEQMNCVGNNDLCPVNPRQLGTGDDSDKSNSRFFHYFYCFDVKDTDKFNSVSDDKKKFFSGETIVVKKHTSTIASKEVVVKEDKYIPSLYYFKTRNVLYIVINSEIPYGKKDVVQSWYGIGSANAYANIYTGIEVKTNGLYVGDQLDYFTPIYETVYAWLKTNQDDGNNSKKVVVAMHEMPFTVITRQSLENTNQDRMPYTRNYPVNGTSRVGSNVNQIYQTENRGLCWCSRLLEYFNCKLVIGGHKHTYALTYPIKEKYSWTKHETYIETNPDTGEEVSKEIWYDSKDTPKPMLATLADEAGANPANEVDWYIDISDMAIRTKYNITTETSSEGGIPLGVKLNSTKIPYVPENLYNRYAGSLKDGDKFLCCTKLKVNVDKPEGENYNPTYDGFVTYSMCQATGYKLKSNKELPAQTQLFSKIIPQTKYKTDGTDGPHANQLYPMYSVLEFNDDCSEVNVSMNRIVGILLSPGSDTFTQGEYGGYNLNVHNIDTDLSIQTLCTYEKEDICILKGKSDFKFRRPIEEMNQSDVTSGAEVGDLFYATDEDKVYECTVKSESGPTWTEVIVNTKIYGKWLNEADAKTRYQNHDNNPTTVSDNRYLHIKF